MVCLKSFFQKKKLTIFYFKKMDTVHTNDTTEAFLSRAGTLKPKHKFNLLINLIILTLFKILQHFQIQFILAVPIPPN